MTEVDWRAELNTRTTEILGRFGVAGRVEVEGHLVWLIGHGPTVEVRLSESELAMAAAGSIDLKALAERLARDLARARRKATGTGGSRSSWLSWLRLVPPVAITAVGVWAVVRYLVPHQPTDTATVSTKSARLSRGFQRQATKANERQLLDDQNCARAVTRIQQGGTISPLDIDGWVVELSLLSESPRLDPAIAALDNYFPRQPGSIERTHHAPNTPLLNQAQGDAAGVLVSKTPLAVSGLRGSGITITWRGKYVMRYFDQVDRSEYTKVADALFLDLGASYGALYARCIQAPARYVGSWFRGPTVGGALWILVAEMEVVSGSATVPSSTAGNSPENWTEPLHSLAEKLQGVTRKRAALILASSGGSVSERPGQFATVEFPFSPANRANLAASAIARKVWPGDSTPVAPATP